MFDLGDELAIESYRIPWLIWIQLLVFFLLLLILFCFTILPLDPDDDAAAAAAATTTPATSSPSTNDIQQIDKPIPKNDSTATATVVTNRPQHMQGGQSLIIKGQIATGASMRIEEITEGEASSLNFHPCHYFELATVAFLKCFGLDFTSDRPSTRRRRKRKES